MTASVRSIALSFWVLLAATLLGFFAFVFPPADIANHFRPYILGGCAAVFILTAWRGDKRLAVQSGLLSAANVILFALPMFSAPHVSLPAHDGPTLKVLSFNVWAWNRDLPRVARYVLEQDADVVLFQELPERHAEKLLPLLIGAYPHVKTCDCHRMALLSKRNWIDDGSDDRIRGVKPGLIWASFTTPGGSSFRVIGVHPSYPLRPWDQAQDYAWLTNYLAGLSSPAIVAGDFNVTPWSFWLMRLAWTADLRRHGTFQRSWPAHFGLIPAFLIDNVLTTADIGAVSFETGPFLGSDHRPIVVDVGFP